METVESDLGIWSCNHVFKSVWKPEQR